MGRLVILRDITASRTALHGLLWLVGLLAAAALALLLGLMYVVTGQAERALDRSYRKLADSHRKIEQAQREWVDVFDTIKDPIFLHDKDYRVLRANRAYAERAGMDIRDVIGRPYWEAFPRGDGPLPKCGAALSGKSGLEAGEEQEEEVRLENGEMYLSRSFYTRDDEGQFRYSVHILENYTERERLLAELKNENRARRAIGAGNQVLIHAQDKEELLREACRNVVEVGGYRMAWVGFKRDDADKSIEIASCAVSEGSECAPLTTQQLTWAKTEASQRPAAEAIRSGQRQIVQDIQAEPAVAAGVKDARQVGYRAVLAFPLKEQGKVFGVLSIHAAEAHAFDEAEIALLGELAEDIAYGIVALDSRAARNRAEAARREILDKLEASMTKTVQAMAAAVEARDPYTAGHQQCVAELAVALAAELELPDDEVEGIRIAGIIHDIGKIKVPAEILNRPGKLSDMEFGLIKAHPQDGYDILKGIDFPWPVADMVLQHHERLDGTGYPNGLKDGAILRGARILAVADVVEAMASHRPYRAGLGMEKALDEIRAGAGTRYDPEVVEACEKLCREKGYKLKGFGGAVA